jgi:hypothetical protein
MSNGAYDNFALIIFFWGLIGNQNPLQLCFFETFDTSRHELAKNLTELLSMYDLRKKKLC